MKTRKLCFVSLLSEPCTGMTVRLSYNNKDIKIIRLWTGQCRNVSLEDGRLLHLTVTGDDGGLYFQGLALEEKSLLIIIHNKGMDMRKNPLIHGDE
jgi:hypothetical protein